MLARTSRQDWPVCEDHCFQRIVLDTICGGVWYAHLDRPAYKNLSHHQAQLAVDLCHKIVEGHSELRQFNNQSLIWRGKNVAGLERPLRSTLDTKMNVAEGCEGGLEHRRELEDVVQD